ncbi:MAG: hypothetical protein ABJE10_08535 [bacterium]
MPSIVSRRAALAALFVVSSSASAVAQGLDLTINHVGLAIGDVPEVTGLRLNFRDRNMRRVDGINATIWGPYENSHPGTVRGLALGLPLTGAGNIDGVATGILGVGVEHRFRGVGIAPIGLGAGGSLEGIMLGGIGLGAGGEMTGIGIGGIGVGAGGRMKGIFLGGIGVGTGGDAEGLLIGGIGVGGGGNVRGIAIGGIGVGGGGSFTGLSIGGIGVGSGGDVTGVSIGGIGVGAGGTLTGLAIGGIGVGAPTARGVMIGGIATGAQEMHGIMLAGAYNKIDKGSLRGLAVAPYNDIRGVQHGWAIGVINIADELDGVQVGLLNIARNNPSGRKVLPIVNWH